ncbi:MAG: putative lipoprotein [bacterium]|nr:putative lipoprotein [bacterium]
MWSAFVNARRGARLPLAARVAALVALSAGASCGPRALDVTLTIDASGCMLAMPAGGSLLYQVEANGTAASLCGGCLAVDAPLADAAAVVAFLRTHAPSCSGVHPGTTLAIRVTGWTVAGCPSGNAPRFCADAPSQLVPDGTSDSTLAMHLGCMAQCNAACVPTTCAAQGKDCGAISDGCNMVLDCGTCKPPTRCGAVTPNVCSR